MKSLIKKFVPPILMDAKRAMLSPKRRLCGYFLKGSFASWSDALQASSGYAAPDLVDRVAERNLAQARACVEGETTFEERDVQILSSLLVAANRTEKTSLHVVDLGGALGGFYRSLQRVWPSKVRLRWTVLETETMAAKGNELFASEALSFIHDDSYLERNRDGVDIVLASGVLQCLEKPHVIFDGIAKCGAKHCIVSILPLIDRASDILTMRIVRGTDYEESYPLWAFSEPQWLDVLQRHHTILMRWKVTNPADVLDDGTRVACHGFLLERKI